MSTPTIQPDPLPLTPTPQTPTLTEQAQATASYILKKIASALPSSSSFEESIHVPRIAIIAGSGLSSLAKAFNTSENEEIEGDTEEVAVKVEIPYSELDGFVVGSSHASTLIYGTIGSGPAKTPVLLLSGRAHYYEGHPFSKTTFPLRVLKLLGVETCIITNAAGSLNKSYNVGDIVIINDHINLAGLAGLSPLRGPNLDDFGTRFLALTNAYDLDLRHKAHLAWAKCNQVKKLNEGVYAFAAGPCYETRAETRMLSMLGGDLVGMSTVPEVIVARHAGMRVFGVSIVTNSALHDPPPLGSDPDVEAHVTNKAMEAGSASHTEVLAATHTVADDIRELIVKLVELIASDKQVVA
ncbi:hypothetical protein HYFRA_00001431 [Hymenoscyphus fraxineus]|uniref:purine-nucleoside phosphorylase n=1 Tax=Hymenoscyphus fraxineus TaxID=746836 RepID=A0A9N9L3E2_9HELO|nr:hypothetical protein HYFRA_00001431 [Hymenoscyphus fraxineus]